MKSGNYINPVYKLSLRDATQVPRRISYSQWSMYEKCPKQWKLSYIDGLAPFNYGINLSFGTAFHETLQDYLTVLYTDSVKQADKLDLSTMLINNLRKEYTESVEKNNGEHFSNPDELTEYLEDGIEVELCSQASEDNPNVFWYGFIDLVVRHIPSNTITIYDIKTSRMGWNKWQKADNIKSAQLIAYKNYFSKQFGIPKENIDVEFFIVKRKLIENSMFPQKRIQIHRPAAGTVTQKKVQKSIDTFISNCFDKDGNKNTSAKYLAIAGKGSKHCKWCPFKTDDINCPKKERIRE